MNGYSNDEQFNAQTKSKLTVISCQKQQFENKTEWWVKITALNSGAEVCKDC